MIPRMLVGSLLVDCCRTGVGTTQYSLGIIHSGNPPQKNSSWDDFLKPNISVLIYFRIPRIIGHGKHQEWNLMICFYRFMNSVSHILLCWSQFYTSRHSNMNQIVCSKLLTIQINHPQWRGEPLHRIACASSSCTKSWRWSPLMVSCAHCY